MLSDDDLIALSADLDSDRVERKRNGADLPGHRAKGVVTAEPADGAIGAHQRAAQDCGGDFRRLANRMSREIETLDGQRRAGHLRA